MNVNQVAFCTVTVLAVATIASVVAVAAVTHAAAMTAFSALAVTLAAISVAAIAAWAQKGQSESIREYFNATYNHSGHTIPGAYQFVAQVLVQGLIFHGIGTGLGRVIANRIAS